MNTKYTKSSAEYCLIIFSKWLILAAMMCLFSTNSIAGIRNVRDNLITNLAKPKEKTISKVKVDTISKKSEIEIKLKEYEQAILRQKESDDSAKNAKKVITETPASSRRIVNTLSDNPTKAEVPVKVNSDNQSTKKTNFKTVFEQMQEIKEEQSRINFRIDAAETDINNLKFAVGELQSIFTKQNQAPKAPSKGDADEVTHQNISQTNVDEEILPDNVNELMSEAKMKPKETLKSPITVKAPSASAKKPIKTKQIAKAKSEQAKANIPEKPKTTITPAKKDINSQKQDLKPSPPTTSSLDNNLKPSSTVAEKSEDLRGALEDISRKDYNNAIGKLNKIIEKDKSPKVQCQCNYYIGESYYHVKQYDKAITYFNKSLNYKNTENADIAQLMVAESYVKSGQADNGKKAYQQLIEKYPQSEYIPKARKMLQML
ncbi:MAG: tetratricopeptide repeat protein [Candidatus Kapabacteria bacterium]|nr:tetratricopeptide repeat protein [Candidatus Kapabacteria bacterium]